MRDRNDRIITDPMEQLIESGPDGMASAFTTLLNLAMRLEREQHPGARSCERTPERGGYANGYKSRRLDTAAGTLTVQVPGSRGGDETFYPQSLERGDRATAVNTAFVQQSPFGLVLPVANTQAMQIFLDAFAAPLPSDVHAVMVLDRAGWHGAAALAVSPSVTFFPLPSYSPQLNPIERVWLYLRERFLSLRLFETVEDIVGACCHAWNAVADDPERIRSLCFQPWIRKISQ